MSTLLMKQGLNYRQSLAVLKKKYKEFTPALSVILWTLSGIYAIAKSHFNTSVSGVTLSFVVSDLLMMSLASLILCKGLVDKKMVLLLPWLFLTGYSLYFTHYQGVLSILAALKQIKKITWLPWSNIIANVFLLIVRGTLTIRMFQLGVHLWFKQKLNEFKAKQT